MNIKLKDIIYCLLILFILFNLNKLNNNYNRYTIINGNLGVILLDKQTGLSWRQIRIEKDEPAAYWEEMLIYDGLNKNVPKGKEKQKKELLKSEKKDFWDKEDK